MKNVKNCIMCFCEIDERAKKCPQCRSLQAKFSNLENNPILITLLSFLILGIFGFIFYENFYLRDLKDQAADNLVAKVDSISIKLEGDTQYVACLGEVKNVSGYQFKGIQYQVEFFDDNNQLIDSFAVSDDDIVLKPDSNTTFRVRGVAHQQLSAYTVCQVTISEAWGN
ncbi:hypothetical protein tinsulaeT_06430 [Thalassotalea insulae]|uniref:DUF3426 domain-containing protein n=1 Tax=Thalassotalea insulae TaxID=2056778 RepID=A0ABQ6GMT3_9GAMM|nr:hypothetical protein [Thalassotalea insulae]GLX77303.1 hypothetical protein tinsulaeT_06430 [Thalassotalea insulae]